MTTAENNHPVVSENDGIKLKIEKMATDKLYHCIYDNKVFLFYKDDQSLLHCYEIENPKAVKEISENPSKLDSILKRYAELNLDHPQ
jgi:hypothetical protein